MRPPLPDGLTVTEYRFDGLQRGNDDLADTCQWTPPADPERVPLLVDFPKADAFKDYAL